MISNIKDYIIKHRLLFILFIGFFLRLAFIGRIPGNNNYFQDEAFSAYEAYSQLTYGIDSHGYHNPVYLEVWGSGMSAVQCYCQMFFIKLLGFKPIAIRLPQAILACITLIFFYLLIKEISDEEISLWATFIMAICPWHLCMSRWGLDCNYFVCFITMAMYLLISSRNRLGRTILAGAVGGFALYCYASPWIVMPILIFGTLIYLFVRKEITIKSILIYGATMGIVAIPILTFVAVNMGFIAPIQTSFFSIPKMGFFRSTDVGLSFENLWRTISFFWVQYDLRSWNSTPRYGIYFLFSNVFLILGLIKNVIKPSKHTVIIWIWFACSLILGALVEVNFNRLNIAMIPLLYFIASGIVFTISLFKKHSLAVKRALMALYGAAGLIFAVYYFTGYNEMMERVWTEGAEEAIVYAQEYDGTVHVQDMLYPIILCYSKYPVEKFVDTVVYLDPYAEYLSPLSFEGYDLTDFTEQEPVSGDVYICSVENTAAAEYIANNDMACAQLGSYYVGIAR